MRYSVMARRVAHAVLTLAEAAGAKMREATNPGLGTVASM